jgi:hypothetical protein
MARWFRLAEWGQDEVVADPLPLSLTLENITLHIEDDRPPAAPGLPSAPPLDLSVPARLRVARDRFGVVNICGAEMTEGVVAERAELCPSKVNVRAMETISRSPTFKDFVTVLPERSMQDITVARLQSTRVPTPPRSFKCNVLRESHSVDSQNIPCATLNKRGSWVISVNLW